MDKPFYTVHDVIKAGYTLEPMICLYCGGTEVEYMQYISDAYCADCGRWQLDIDECDNECVCGNCLHHDNYWKDK